MGIKEDFENWLLQNNKPGSGKAKSYLTGMEDVQTIAQAGVNFKIPSVYSMPDDSLISLRDYIDVEKRKEKNASGSGAFHGIQGLHGVSYWRDGHCSAVLSQLIDFRKNVKRNDSLESDRLTIALKLFREARECGVTSEVRYWVFSPGERACRWDEMRKGGYAALSYEGVNDLRSYADAEALRAVFQTREGNESSHKNDVRALMDFRDVMKPGDFVFAKNGTTTFLAVGRVAGEYEFVADASDYKHRRKVEWFKIETVEREDQVARKTLTDVTRFGDLVRELCDAYGVEGAVNSDEGNWGCQDVRDWFDAFTPEKLKEDFAYFRSRMLWSKRVQGAIGREYAHIDELGAVMKELKESPRPIGYYASEEFAKKCPDGFGKSTATDFLMKFHPNEYISFTGNMMDALDFLGLWPTDVKRDMTVCYNELIGAATRVRNRMNDLEIGRFAEGKKPEADYLTVNEFLWWTNEHKDLIKEKVMKESQIKAEPDKLKKDGKKNLSDLIAGGPDSLMTMLTAALLAKPFAILAGASGTGKSRMVKKLAYMTCNADQLRSEKDETPGNYCMVAVKPNWHDSSDLLGYRSAISKDHEYITPDFIKFILRAHAFPHTPFFVCLDEMNLAPVEQYFAEFLSACESVRKNSEGEWVSDPLILPGEFDNNVANLAPEYSLPDACVKRIDERGLYIPRNLFVVGTVNMDDTTHQFSRKVLDRAMTLMMDDVDFGTLQDAQYEKLTNDLLMNGDDIKKFIDRGEFEGGDLEEVFKDMLGRLQAALKESPFAIGYRFAIESVLYRKALALLGVDAAALDATAADHMALMKILPRITGTLTERDAVLKSLTSFFASLGEHKQSGSRLEKMKTAARQNGDYISFWP